LPTYFCENILKIKAPIFSAEKMAKIAQTIHYNIDLFLAISVHASVGKSIGRITSPSSIALWGPASHKMQHFCLLKKVCFIAQKKVFRGCSEFLAKKYIFHSQIGQSFCYAVRNKFLNDNFYLHMRMHMDIWNYLERKI
jgi:hypothetical protein